MPRHSILFHPSARDEMAAAYRWYRDLSPAAANAFLFEIERALELILESPDRWPTHVHGTRRLLLRRFPFVVIFSSTPSTVRIYAIPPRPEITGLLAVAARSGNRPLTE